MMKHLLFRFTVLILTFSMGLQPYFVFSQISDYTHIRSSGDYYWGIGKGTNFSEARRNALADLSESLQVDVRHNYKAIVVEENGNLEEYVKSVVTTYSSAVLSFYETKVLNEEAGNWEALTYISKDKMSEYYDDLEQYIDDFILYARRAEQYLRIADALKYYYWALLLTRGHPENQKLRNAFGVELEESLYLGLIDRLNSIFSFLNIDVIAMQQQDDPPQTTFDLFFTYRGRRIQNLDYTYWIGDGYSAQYSANNGIGVAILEGEMGRTIRSLRIMPEYQYRNKARTEMDVNRMFENIDLLPVFANAERAIPVNVEQPTTAGRTEQHEIRFETIGAGLPEYDHCKNALQQVITAIQGKNHELARRYFTDDGFEMYQKLITSGEVTVLRTHLDTLSLVKVGNNMMARSVPMLFAYYNNREKFVENVVFTFDESKKKQQHLLCAERYRHQ
jgi:hypothetical protein